MATLLLALAAQSTTTIPTRILVTSVTIVTTMTIVRQISNVSLMMRTNTSAQTAEFLLSSASSTRSAFLQFSLSPKHSPCYTSVFPGDLRCFSSMLPFHGSARLGVGE
jgi:hypothetical protein